MAERQENAAEQHRLALPQIAVGQIAAEHRGDIDERGIGAVDQVRFGVREQPVLRQIEDQQRPHAVIGETLPHLGEEEHVEALRSEEHTSELQSLMRISYAVFCLKKKKQNNQIRHKYNSVCN